MLANLSVWHVVVAVVGLLVFGPDRLPHAAARLVRRMRHIAHAATSELRAELGPELGDPALAASRPQEALLHRGLLEHDAEAPASQRGGPGPACTGRRSPYDVEVT